MRLSITTIESFRLWRDGNWMALEDLEATFRGEFTATPIVKRGRAFHAVLEDPDGTLITSPDEPAYYRSGYYRFNADSMQPVLDLLPPDRVNECKAEMVLDGVTIVGKADSLYGVEAIEAKSSHKSMNPDRYADSCQWRFYCLLFDLRRVTYLLAQLYESRKDKGYHTIRNVQTVPLYSYPALRDDMRRLMNECAELIVRRGLESYVQGRAA